jgi:hypothetical protein
VSDENPVEKMIAAVSMRDALTMAKDSTLTTDQWWDACEPRWRTSPAYFSNLETKAKRHGRQWVRDHMSGIHGFFKNAAQHEHINEWVAEHGNLDDW